MLVSDWSSSDDIIYFLLCSLVRLRILKEFVEEEREKTRRGLMT